VPEDCQPWEINDIVTLWGTPVTIRDASGEPIASHTPRARKAAVREYIPEKDSYAMKILEKGGWSIIVESRDIQEGPCRDPTVERWDPQTSALSVAYRIAEDARVQKDPEFERFKDIVNKLFADLPDEPIRMFVKTPDYELFSKVLSGSDSPEERGKFATIVDSLLSELPREKIVEFVKSADYEHYKTTINQFSR